MISELKIKIEEPTKQFGVEQLVSLPPRIKLIHFSIKPVEWVYTTKREQKVDYKPNGFWVSDEGEGNERGWKDWCEGESFATDRFVYENEIILSHKAKILFINSVNELDNFHNQYQAALPGMEKWGNHYIDWKAVAKDFQGILITPYLYERRFTEGMNWYYSWDCASGCIWNKSAIKLIKTKRSG